MEGSKLKNFFLTTLFIFLIFTASCGGGGGGGEDGAIAQDGDTASTTYTISGIIRASSSTAMDADVNDINAPYTSNDTIDTAQSIPNPVTVGGYVNVASQGPSGRSQATGDELDIYKVALSANQVIALSLTNPQQIGVLDIDLYLLDLNGNVIDASLGTSGTTETLIVTQQGEYLIGIEAVDGASNYILRIGMNAISTVTSVPEMLRLGDDFVPGEVITRFKETVLPASGDRSLSARAQSVALIAKAGVAGREMLLRLGNKENRIEAFKVLGISHRAQTTGSKLQLKLDTLLVIKALRKRADVKWAEPNYIRKTAAIPNDQFYPYQWHYTMINLPQAWDITTGNDVIVAVIDTGVLLSHPDLQGQFVAGYDFIQDPDRALDGDGIDSDPDDPGDQSIGGSSFHGTHVAGTIAATTNNTTGVAGIAWSAKIMPLRVLGKGGGTNYDILQALRYAAGLNNDSGTIPSQAADIINLSLGGGVYSQIGQDVYTQVRDAGVIIIAAAGNDSTDAPGYPASYDGVVSVSAVDMEGNLAPYSNFGQFIDIAAPGGDTSKDVNGDGYQDGVLSTAGDDSSEYIKFVYKFYQGTSMAAPHVAGVIALMKSLYPGLTPDELDILLQSGDITADLGSPGRDNLFGYGLIDAYKAVVAAELASSGVQPPPNPTLVVTPSSVNFGTDVSSVTISVTNGGGGTLSADTPTDSVTWLDITPSVVDSNGLGSYTVSVDRTGLSDGIYTATITFTSSANTVTVQVIIKVGATITGDAGYHYVLLVDPDTFDTIAQVEVEAISGIYSYTFTDVQSGTYMIFAGTDSDNDQYICAIGEACGAYISLDMPKPVTVNSDLTGLDFDTSFDVNINAASASSESRQGFARIRKFKLLEK